MSEWVPVPGHEANYKISDKGTVWSRPRPRTAGGLLKLRVGKRGYLLVNLVTNGKQDTYEVHRLVALAFLGSKPAGTEVRHLDGDALNCAVSNLAYGTRSQNNLDKRGHGTDHNVAKTHCPKGHSYDSENTIVRSSRRYCRACERARTVARRAAA